MNDFKLLGLKTKWDFKEVRIWLPRVRSMKDVHDKIFFIVLQVIRALEANNLINGFHFIIHDHIDLRLSCGNWDKKKVKIAHILEVYGIGDSLVPWCGLDPNIYGGEEGAILCYNNLEYNSRLVMGIVLANYTGDKEPDKRKRAGMEFRRDDFVYGQFPHFLRAQFGVGNALEAQIDLGRFWSNVKIIRREQSKKAAIKLFVKSFRQVFLKR